MLWGTLIDFDYFSLVLYVGKGGFWEGKVGDVTGWFPQHAITAEKTEGKVIHVCI